MNGPPNGLRIYWYNTRTGSMECARTAGSIEINGVRYLRATSSACLTAPMSARDSQWGYIRLDQIDRPGGLVFSSLQSAALAYRDFFNAQIAAAESEINELKRRIAYCDELLAGVAA